MHEFPPLLLTLAVAFTAAWLLGLLTQRLGLSPIVGYLLAGVLVGPYTPGPQADATLVPQLAELGVILLMFGVGLHFHLKDLLAVKWIAIPGAVAQSAVATAASALILLAFGWTMTQGAVIGMAMAVASTVVLIRVLNDSRRMNTQAGHIAVGWLIVEDIFTVVILVLLPTLTPDVAAGAPAAGAGAADAAHAAADAAHAAAGTHWAVDLAWALGKLVLMVALVLVGGSEVVPWVLVQVARLRSRELFTLTVLVLSVAVATATAVFFGASVALGAFLAGMVVAQSPVSQQAGSDALPMRDAFSVIFFVSVGMLMDPALITSHPWLLVAGLGVVLVVKPLVAVAVVAALGYPLTTGLTVAVGLAQIGEFSFIVGDSALKLGLIPAQGRDLLVACALVSITINPLLFKTLPPLERWLRGHSLIWRALNYRAERKAHQRGAHSTGYAAVSGERPLAVVVGYGPVGQQVDRLLIEGGFETVIIELSIDAVSALLSRHRAAVFGDATQAEVLTHAGVKRASHLIMTTPHTPDIPVIIAAAKRVNPGVRIVMRTRYMREEEEMRRLGATVIVVDEVESAHALVECVRRELAALT